MYGSHVPLQIHVQRIDELRLVGRLPWCREEQDGVTVALGGRFDSAAKKCIYSL